MATTIAGDRVVDPNAAMSQILATIRGMESGGNYTQLNKTASASGAYQYVNGTWVSKSKAVPGAGSYPRAYQAPPAIQDAVAEADVRAILSATGNHLAAVPVMWYYPISWPPREGTAKGQIDYKPDGNPLTVREYAVAWLKRYDGVKAGGGGITVGGGGGGGSSAPVPADTMSFWEKVQFGFTNPLDTLGGVLPGTPFDALTTFVAIFAKFGEFISNPDSWVRILKVIGGVIAIGMGLWIITHDQPMAAGANLVKRGAVTAAVV